MSILKISEITCPKCGEISYFKTWESINTTFNPDMKEKVISGEAFKFVCPECGDSCTVSYNFIYHQMEDKTMIHYVNNEEEFYELIDTYTEEKLKESDMISESLKNDYNIRIVRSHTELVDKIRIIDAGLDDRIVEICKLLIIKKIRETVESDLVKNQFYQDAGVNYVKFHFKDQVITAELSDEMYNDLAEIAKGKLSRKIDDNLVVDFNWAVNFLEEFKEAFV